MKLPVIPRIIRHVAAAVSAVLIPTALFVSNAAPVSAATVYNQTSPVSSAFNSCNGDIVAITGEVHSLMTVTNGASGGLHVTIASNFEDTTGTGVFFGGSYVVAGTAQAEGTMAPSSTMEVTAQNAIIIASTGSSQNLVIDFVFHITANPDGTLTAYVTLDQGRCVG
jgi:hypothetical protein